MSDSHGHAHTHGAVDPALVSSARGIRAVKWSFVALFTTSLAQLAVARWSGSVALLGDTIHNFGDAWTTLPLWLAFRLTTVAPTKRFTYGFGRVEDLAGVLVVLAVLSSAMLTGWASVARLMSPEPVEHLAAVMGAAVVGFVGNQIVAALRLKVGREIGSAALVADGHHARMDGLASLAVLAGAIGVKAGWPKADPIVGLLMTALLLEIVYETGHDVFTRLLDGVEPEVVDELVSGARATSGVLGVSNVRVRWSGHRMYAELSIAVDAGSSVVQAHEVGLAVRRRLLERLRYLFDATIHVDSPGDAGCARHGFAP